MVARELVAEQPVIEVSLAQLATTAGVSRPAVYENFGDVATAVAEATKDLLERTFVQIDAELADIEPLEYAQQLMNAFIDALYAQRKFYRNAMHGPSSLTILVDTMKILDARMRHNVFTRLGATTAADAQAAITAGLACMVIDWLESDLTGANAPEIMAQRLVDVLMTLSTNGTPQANEEQLVLLDADRFTAPTHLS